MSVFDDAAADLHGDEDLAVAASYRLPPGTWQNVRVILSQPKDDLGNAIAGKFEADLPCAGITDTPRKGAELRIDGVVRRVEKALRDAEAVSWRLTLSDPVAS